MSGFTKVAALVRFVTGLGGGALVIEICNYHALHVNPNELSMSHTFFEEAFFIVEWFSMLCAQHGLTPLAYERRTCQATETSVRPSLKRAHVRLGVYCIVGIHHKVGSFFEFASKCAPAEATSKQGVWLYRFRGASLSQINKLVDKAHFLLKVALILTNYTAEAVTERMRPNPDLCRFLVTTEIATLVKECRAKACSYKCKVVAEQYASSTDMRVESTTKIACA